MKTPRALITLDGPSGSGKGTLGHRIADTLGWHFLDSGALYRILAHNVQVHNLSVDDDDALVEIATGLAIAFKPDQIICNGEVVTHAIRTEGCGAVASRIATRPRVREALISLQHAFEKPPGLVADGRDMGTVVFPEAPLKFFVTASAESRAKRRFYQLQQAGLNANLTTLLDEIRQRDARDASRPVAPMRPATDAIVVDTTELGVEESFERLMDHVQKVFGGLTSPR